MSDVAVVIPARDAEATLGRTLAALSVQRGGIDFEVIVVDSGSRDRTREVATTAPGSVRLLSNPGGEPASSRNLGVRSTGARAIAFTDADCEPTPGWLQAGLRELEHADIVQGPVRPVHPPGPFDRTVSVTHEHGLYETANLFVRRETFESTGGFEAVLPRPGGRPWAEDTWFVWRARRAGARTAFAPEAVVAHAVFDRSATGFIAERARCRLFPPLVARIPELRDAFLYRRWFLSAESFRFDLALAGVGAARLLGSRRLANVAGAAYLAPQVRRARWARRGLRLRVGVALVAADAVTFVSLLAGSTAARTAVL